jgi:AAA domain
MKVNKLVATSAPLITLYGAEGRGKTTLASKFPKPLFLALERGIPRGVAVDCVEGIDSFDAVIKLASHLYANGPGEYASLVVDTGDQLQVLLLADVIARNGWKDIEAPGFGKGWIAADDAWRRILRAFLAIRDKHNMIIVLVCHSTIERVDDPRAPSYTAYAPKLHKRARALVMDASDAVLFLSEDLRVITDSGGFSERTRASASTGRFLFTEGRPAYAAKNRFAMAEKIALPIDFDITTLAQYWAPHKQKEA